MCLPLWRSCFVRLRCIYHMRALLIHHWTCQLSQSRAVGQSPRHSWSCPVGWMERASSSSLGIPSCHALVFANLAPYSWVGQRRMAPQSSSNQSKVQRPVHQLTNKTNTTKVEREGGCTYQTDNTCWWVLRKPVAEHQDKCWAPVHGLPAAVRRHSTSLLWSPNVCGVVRDQSQFSTSKEQLAAGTYMDLTPCFGVFLRLCFPPHTPLALFL